MASGTWMYVGGRAGSKPPLPEKAAITAACERLIAEVLQPRFLPEVRPSAKFNYPVYSATIWMRERVIRVRTCDRNGNDVVRSDYR